MIAIGCHKDGRLSGEASRQFNYCSDLDGYGNFENHKFVSKNERMDEMSEDDFVKEMEKEISFILSMGRSIHSKELMITK